MNKAYTYELNLLDGVLSMALKLSLRLSMSAYLERIALYVEHVKEQVKFILYHAFSAYFACLQIRYILIP